MDQESTISVFVQKMRVNLRIGLEAHERTAPQPVEVSVELFAAPEYLRNVDKDGLMDYARLYDALKSWESRPHVELLETYMRELLAVCFDDARVIAVRASLSKPEIFSEAKGAGVAVFIRRGDWST